MAMMPWLLLFVLLFVDTSLADKPEEPEEPEHVSGCYNKNFSILLIEASPSDIPDPAKASVYFTPSIPAGPQRLVLENGQLKDNRYNLVSNKSGLYFEVPQLNAEDQGIFSVILNDIDMDNETFSLTVTECAHLERLDYGSNFSILLDGDILEFTRRGSYLEPALLWNRSDPTVSERGRGRVVAGHWLAKNITQSDQGNFTLRDVKGKAVSTTVLIVTETKTYDYLKMNEDLVIDLPFSLSKVTLLFHPEIAKCNINNYVRPRVLIRDGVLVLEEKQSYEGRLKMSNYQIVLEKFQIADVGSYHVHDPQGNLATTVEVEILLPSEAWKVAVLPVVGIVFMLLGYYWKSKGRTCCKGVTGPMAA
ncbi:uncharacterized protein LOC125292118 isoform X1 [Alosa alosa]|uniref:uncharacterized protein LOC121685389 isoform X2 n=1 Tax=Alosa sapidissima TaxID=34773 RepID=UPI001C087A33|nr:uncharacterized protein LOC121685389 isoform X2 [Alosa sapidissima]XP_048095241.1 uncharacterized protein LOC125292118 isoform X1 [Alosa alosa]XP_048095242.1 uncharacterized protein LOC125292118 isoform X1 [Alosa alosa]